MLNFLPFSKPAAAKKGVAFRFDIHKNLYGSERCELSEENISDALYTNRYISYGSKITLI